MSEDEQDRYKKRPARTKNGRDRDPDEPRSPAKKEASEESSSVNPKIFKDAADDIPADKNALITEAKGQITPETAIIDTGTTTAPAPVLS